MDTHIRILAILFIIFGVLGVLVAIAFFLLGAGVGATILAEEQDADAQVGAAWATGCMTFIAALIGILSLPSIIAGWGLWARKSWSRVLTLILGVLSLPGFPFGTALGVYAIVVMVNDETRTLLNG